MFRKEAIEYQKKRWEGKAILLPGIPFVYIIFLSIFFISAVTVFLAKGTYTRRVVVHGEITTFPGPINIYAPTQGTVVQKYISEGDHVKKGDKLFLIHSGISTQSGFVDENKKKDIDLQIKSISTMMLDLKSTKQNMLNSLTVQKQHYQSSFNTSSGLLAQAQMELNQIAKNVSDYHSYQKKDWLLKIK
ncbi:HlyD family secretion protein [Klebsiella pneumoniae]|nr:HlyD family secretion protein [Klebsiella pneumoniae]HCM3804572.1 biotin/lipoyl-binding protein [Klebsiella variicola subsp. variicola]